MQKMVTVNSRKYNVQFVMKAVVLTIAVYSRIKHLRREAKYYGRKSCAMDVIHQYHKITMQNHVQRRTWKICKQFRPTGLHGYLPKQKQPKVTNDPKNDVLPIGNKKLMTSNFAEMNVKCNS